MIDEFFGQIYSEITIPSWNFAEQCLEPLIDIEDKDDKYIIKVDLPCVEDKNDITINLIDNLIEISAKIKSIVKWERWGTIEKQIEFKYFKKMIKLPSRVDGEKSKAIFRKGILEITLIKFGIKKRIPIE